MKKIYSLALLLCLALIAGAQTTDTIWAVGPPYITGSALQPLPTGTITRDDPIIAVANSTTTKQAGYAVFDISGIPAGATVSYVELGVNVFGYTAPGGPLGTCTTYGHSGSLTTVTVPATLLGRCTGTGGTAVSTTSYGTGAPYDWSIASITNPALGTFISGQVAIVGHQYVSMSFSTAGTTTGPIYNLKGRDGSLATAGPHAPYLIITYCFKPVIDSAKIRNSPICAGATFSLTGGATGAAGYRWRGPGGFMTTVLNTTAIATAASQGVYTLTAYTACGTYADSTTASSSSTTGLISTPLTVTASPAALITPTATVCTGNTIYMSDITPGGVWTSSNNTLATVSSTGTVVAGASKGRPVISYTLGSCSVFDTVTVNEPPGPILGANEVCASGGTLLLSDAITGIPNGTWSSSVSSLATVHPVTGVVTGVSPGSINISYFTGACPTVTHAVTVNPLPNPILGPNSVCVNASITLNDATPNGTWTSENTSLAVVTPIAGVVTGVAATPTVTITYTLPTGCYVTKTITVLPIPDPITGPSNVCVGQVINLSESSPDPGVWSSSSVATATVVAPGVVTGGTVAGSVNISFTFTSPGSCFVIHPVTVDPLPAAITGLDVVCVGASILLGSTSAGGVWSSGTTAVATAEPAVGDVWGVSSGVSWITYTLASTTGCYTTYSVTVLPSPTAIITPAGPATFCAGGSVTLDATPGAGYNFQWYSNHLPIIGANTPSYISNTTEVINLQVTDANGCIKMSDSIQVTLIPSVAIAAGGPTVLCQPQGVVLSVPLAPGILYQWMLNGINIPGANANTFTAVVDGSYTADLVVPGGCASTTPPFTVTVHPMPVPPITFTGTMLTTIPGYISYQWFLNNVAIPGATSTSVTPTVNGSYVVRVVDGNGCMGYSTARILNLGVGQISAADITVYPNPANTVVNIESPVELHAVITSIDGRTLIDQENAKKIDISKLSNGLYMITLYTKDGDRIMISKLIKE